MTKKRHIFFFSNFKSHHRNPFFFFLKPLHRLATSPAVPSANRGSVTARHGEISVMIPMALGSALMWRWKNSGMGWKVLLGGVGRFLGNVSFLASQLSASVVTIDVVFKPCYKQYVKLKQIARLYIIKNVECSWWSWRCFISWLLLFLLEMNDFFFPQTFTIKFMWKEAHPFCAAVKPWRGISEINLMVMFIFPPPRKLSYKLFFLSLISINLLQVFFYDPRVLGSRWES